eukprot:m.440419 g.440419  ORF g.440419 m.440419 type:complete len:60 (-) comp18518_c0_seq1:2210-2389(-)
MSCYSAVVAVAIAAAALINFMVAGTLRCFVDLDALACNRDDFGVLWEFFLRERDDLGGT